MIVYISISYILRAYILQGVQKWLLLIEWDVSLRLVWLWWRLVRGMITPYSRSLLWSFKVLGANNWETESKNHSPLEIRFWWASFPSHCRKSQSYQSAWNVRVETLIRDSKSYHFEHVIGKRNIQLRMKTIFFMITFLFFVIYRSGRLCNCVEGTEYDQSLCPEWVSLLCRSLIGNCT